MISVQTNIICVFISLIFLVFTLRLIKNNILNFKYSFIWLLLSVALVVISIFPQVLIFASNLLGVVMPVNALFFLGLLFVMIVLYGVTIVITSYDKKLRVLNQELAILKEKVNRNE